MPTSAWREDEKMGKTVRTSVLSGAEIDAFRERVAGAVALEVSKLVSTRRDDPKAIMSRKLAAYLLFSKDQLLSRDIALIMDKSDAWVSAATDYIERRMLRSYAFRASIAPAIAAYARTIMM